MVSSSDRTTSSSDTQGQVSESDRCLFLQQQTHIYSSRRTQILSSRHRLQQHTDIYRSRSVLCSSKHRLRAASISLAATNTFTAAGISSAATNAHLQRSPCPLRQQIQIYSNSHVLCSSKTNKQTKNSTPHPPT